MLMFDSSRLYNPDKTQFSLTGGLKFIEAGRGCSRDRAGALSATSSGQQHRQRVSLFNLSI